MFFAVIDDVFVDLVGDGECVILFAEVRDECHFFKREHFACRVVRRIDDDGFRLFVEEACQFIMVERVVGCIEFDITRCRAAKHDVRTVVFVERFEDDDFVTGVDRRKKRCDHAFGRAAANGDLTFGIERDTVVALYFVDDGITELFRAPRDGVLVVVVVDSTMGGILECLRCRKIGESLREIDGLVLIGNARHLTNDRFGELFCFE